MLKNRFRTLRHTVKHNERIKKNKEKKDLLTVITNGR